MKYKLSDLIDIPKLQNLMDIFHAATGITATVLDAEGAILARSGWSNLCVQFHRAYPETEATCRESDGYVRQRLGKEEGIVSYPCANGLMNVAAPVVIDGEYEGAVIIGQFLNGEPDEEQFLRRAREMGFEESAYLKALREVPVIPQERMVPILKYLVHLSEFFVDIGLRQLRRLEMEVALREGEERFRAIANYTYNWESWMGVDGKLLWVNPAVERITGYSVEECLAMPDFPLPLIHEVDREGVARHLLEAARGSSGSDLEFRIRRKDGGLAWEAASWQPIYDAGGASLGYRSSIRDITKRKLVEEELRKSQDRLRNLYNRAQSSREEERTLIAREIHDELGQQLSMLQIDLTYVEDQLPKNKRRVIDRVRSMEELVNTIIRSVQRIATELRPSLLDDLGLAAAIEWQGKEFQKRTGIECMVFLGREEMAIDRDRSTALFRIFQETLTNVSRHAHAKRVEVRLREAPQEWVLEVRDDGVGISNSQIASPKSLGLVGMRERVHPWGGTIDLMGSPGRGTTVIVRLPREKGE